MLVTLNSVISGIGRDVISLIVMLGRFNVFTFNVLCKTFSSPLYVIMILKTSIYTLFASVPIISITSVFVGIVLILQIHAGFSEFDSEEAVVFIIITTIVRELSPVITGILLAGKIGSSFAAEIGSMKSKEQIDALKSLLIDPYKYLIIPRFWSNIIVAPILIIISITVSIAGSFFIAVYFLNFEYGAFIHNVYDFLKLEDLMVSIYKATVFSAIVALSGCYYGFYSEGGVQGVGKATMHSVVASSILILFINYIFTYLFFYKS